MSLRKTTLHPIATDANRQVYGVPISGIPLKLIRQKKGNWCWAACVEMILKYYGVSNDRQCEIARKGLRLDDSDLSADCCDSSASDDCNKRLDDESISRLWREVYCIPVAYAVYGVISGDDIPILIGKFLKLLEAGVPVEMGYVNEFGHVIMLYGHDNEPNSGQFSFYFRDPNPGSEAELAIPADRIFAIDYGRLNATWEVLKGHDGREA